MSGRDTQSPAVGFLTVIESEQLGLVGGYLILNLAGRPLEFHCTAPIKPNRAQQILYGPTLEPYLYGEQIGRALAAKGGTQPLCICTDREPVLALRDFLNCPVAWVDSAADAAVGDNHNAGNSPEEEAQPDRQYRLDPPHALEGRLLRVAVGRNRLGLPVGRKGDVDVVRQRLAQLDPGFDLSEPFERIREAILEAQRGGR